MKIKALISICNGKVVHKPGSQIKIEDAIAQSLIEQGYAREIDRSTKNKKEGDKDA